MRLPTYIILAVIGTSALGCRSNPQGNFNIATRQITIITEPEGAEVIQLRPLGQPSTRLGTTPLENQPVVVISEITRLKNMPFRETESLYRSIDNAEVIIFKQGYKPFTGHLKTEADQIAMHRITLQRKE